MTHTIKAAAIQFEAMAGDVAANLKQLEHFIHTAAQNGAKIIAVPEFCTSQLPMQEKVSNAVLPVDNPVARRFRELAQKYQCWVGGSMLIAESGEIYNRYHLFEPSGQVHCHDKDYPTMWEGCFYTAGQDDGVFSTELGGVGAAVCWELIRNRTAKRMHNKVGLVITGTHWWSVPKNLWPLSWLLKGLGRTNHRLSKQAPSDLAKRLGVPVIQASHCGEFTSRLLLIPGLNISIPYRTEFVGATQIVDGQGHVLASRDTAEGPGIVYADISLGAQPASEPIGDTFWLPKLPWLIRAYWWQQNACATPWYKRFGRTNGLNAAQKNKELK